MKLPAGIERDVALAPLTTLHIGGPARFFARVHTEAEAQGALRFARDQGLPVFVLGGGSNLLVADAGFAGLVLHASLALEVTYDGGQVSASAGVDWDAFVRGVCEQGLAGCECLAGIPGLMGGAPVQNIGAYGQEVATTIARVRALDRHTLEPVELPGEACDFRYRHSVFNSTARDRYLVTRVDFAFDPAARPSLAYADLTPLRGTSPTPLEVYHAVRAIRDRKGMLLDPAHPHEDSRSAGSFFKNPVVPEAAVARIAAVPGCDAASVPQWRAGDGRVKLPAAWLIEQAGFARGYAPSPDSAVGISTRHTLALVNRNGHATCAELLALRDEIVRGVETIFGVTLEQEPVLVGDVG